MTYVPNMIHICPNTHFKKCLAIWENNYKSRLCKKERDQEQLKSYSSFFFVFCFLFLFDLVQTLKFKWKGNEI